MWSNSWGQSLPCHCSLQHRDAQTRAEPSASAFPEQMHRHDLGTRCFVMQVIPDTCTQEADLKILLLINVLSFLLVKMTSVIHSLVGKMFQWKVAWSVSCPSGLSDSSPAYYLWTNWQPFVSWGKDRYINAILPNSGLKNDFFLFFWKT